MPGHVSRAGTSSELFQYMKRQIGGMVSSSVCSQDSDFGTQSSLASFFHPCFVLLTRSGQYRGITEAISKLHGFDSSSSLFGGPTPPEFPSTESAIYLETCLVWALLFISPGQFNWILHLFWLTASTILKSSPLNRHLMCSIP